MKQVLEIPNDFRCPPFFEDRAVIEYNAEKSFGELLGEMYFFFDIEQGYKPWNAIEVSIPTVLGLWKEQKEEISMLFRNRNKKEAKEPMVRFAGHLLSILHWMNGTPVTNLQNMSEQIDRLEKKPVNFLERFSFIMNKPNHYHSFIQLTQLYEEIEKLYVKVLIMQKKPFSR
ncbi:YpoC family protein [Bacillus sp. BP-3]|uniref:YpoC family protein n=1 Tax=Bacillus sp. BP-3 TaxID=3022773 RepID=UPI00232B5993|nr:GTPase [Bacillus sp. BP-3]MDC2865896.1 GTPase [Bacillus sp. BP-3]